MIIMLKKLYKRSLIIICFLGVLLLLGCDSDRVCVSPDDCFSKKQRALDDKSEYESWLEDQIDPSYRDNCNIKGNVSYESQEKIYHLPSCASYNDVIIDANY